MVLNCNLSRGPGTEKLQKRRQPVQPVHLCLPPMNMENAKLIRVDALSNSHVNELDNPRRTVGAKLRQAKVAVAMRSGVNVANEAANPEAALSARTTTAAATAERITVVVAQQILVALDSAMKRLRRVGETKPLPDDLRTIRNTASNREVLVNSERVDEPLALLEERPGEQPQITMRDVESMTLLSIANDDV